MIGAGGHGGGSRAFGYTLVELLVVISIFVLMMVVAVPAFRAMTYSAEQSTAENALRVGLGAARDAAVRAGAGRDAAAVFLYQAGGRASILACLQAGTVEDVDAGGNPVTRDVFAVVPGFEPVHVPRGWTVRGYAAPGLIDGQWYERTYPPAFRTRGRWLFPETDFYDAGRGDQGAQRQTFMVRFQGGTGTLKTETPAVLVLLPAESTQFRGTYPWSAYRADEEEDGMRFVRRVQGAPTSGSGALSRAERRLLLGDEATDTVLARGVGQLAVMNESRLAAALGVRVHRESGALVYLDATSDPPGPALVPGVNRDRLDAWVENRLPGADSDCRLFAVHRHLGMLQEITGTIGAQGVSQP